MLLYLRSCSGVKSHDIMMFHYSQVLLFFVFGLFHFFQSSSSTELHDGDQIINERNYNAPCSICEIKELLLKMDKKISAIEEAVISSKGKTSCADIYKYGCKTDGVYKIDPDGKGSFLVRCDMTTEGGGWTVFQRRLNGSVDFYRGWNDYKNGFGDLNGEFWLGLDKIHRLTKGSTNVLRIDMEDTSSNTRYAQYSSFAVSSEQEKYKLSLGTYSGTAGDSLTYHKGMSFSTKDSDNDIYPKSCAVVYKGAWWYKSCHYSNLNGYYYLGKMTTYADGVIWYNWKGYYYSLKDTEMKIRSPGFH